MNKMFLMFVVLCLPVAAFSQVSIIDTISFIPYSEPYGVAVYRAPNVIYVTLSNEGYLEAIDGVTHSEIASIPTGGYPIDVGVDPGFAEIFVVNHDDDNVHVIDGITHTVIDTIGVGWGPIAAAVDSILDFVYVLNYFDLSVSVIDVSINQIIATVPLLQYDYPEDIAVNQVDHRVFVTHGAAGYVSVIDGLTHVLIDTFTVGGPFISGIDVDPIQNTIYVSNEAIDTVLVISGISYNVIDAEGVGMWPLGLCVNPSTHRIFAANSGSDNMSVIDGASFNLIGTFPAGPGPLRLAVNPDMNRIYLSCIDMDAVIVYGDEGTAVEELTGEPSPLYIRVAPNPFRDRVSISLEGLSAYGVIGVSKISIFDVSGRVVKQFPIPNSQFPIVRLTWDGWDEEGKKLPSGVYYLRVEAGNFKAVRKLLLVK
jgi:YVTN family beta-propeller protein